MAMDRRKDVRSAVHSLAPVPVVFSGKCRGTGWLYDISRTGCKIDANVTPALGASVMLRLSLYQDGLPVVVEEGLVGWTIPERYFGVKFITVKSHHQDALDRYLAAADAMTQSNHEEQVITSASPTSEESW